MNVLWPSNYNAGLYRPRKRLVVQVKHPSHGRVPFTCLAMLVEALRNDSTRPFRCTCGVWSTTIAAAPRYSYTCYMGQILEGNVTSLDLVSSIEMLGDCRSKYPGPGVVAFGCWADKLDSFSTVRGSPVARVALGGAFGF